MRRDLPAGTVTFLFTDIEGSTRLLHSLGPDAYAEALAEHRRVLREAFAAYGGVEVDTQGDAFFVAFPTATGAADAACTAQHELQCGPISVRMGLHTGTPTVTGEGYVGVDVHRGARVGALAHGGQIVLSPATQRFSTGTRCATSGVHRLKDFDTAIRLSQLDRQLPGVRTPGSVEAAASDDPLRRTRARAVRAVSLVYERDPRALTILGPGGTGKTRFAIELCRSSPKKRREGPSSARSRRCGTRRSCSRRSPTGSAPDRATSRRLLPRVGGADHVVSTTSSTCCPTPRGGSEAPAATPGLRLLATSREPLRAG